ncbi:MAG: enolase C-terminal domain-like protein [Alphaproteobacteria bacterium]
MKITKIEPMTAYLPLFRPFKMSGVEIATSENVFARVETDDGLVGWGEASSSPSMTGETVQSMTAAIEFLAPFMIGRDPAAFEENLAEMNWRMYGNASAKTVLEMAFYDAAGKAQQKSMAELLGGVRRTQVPVLYMLATGDIDVDVAEASERAAAGVSHMKIKVGGKPVEKDIERTNAIRKAVNGGVQLSADCNQGWTREEALKFAAEASESLDFLEQPVMGHDVECMAEISAAAACPVGADEGLHSFDDVRKHHALGAAQGGSVKMIKLGGVTRAFQATELFDELGMHVNLAGKIAETSVSSAAVLQIAAAAPSIEWGVSTTAQYLKKDIAKNPVEVINGRADVPSGAGLGIEVDEDALAEFVR